MQVKQGDLIRKKKTGEIYMCVTRTPNGIQVINLKLRHVPALMMLITPAMFTDFERDIDIDKLDSWERQHIQEETV